MPVILWIPIGVLVIGTLAGAMIGANSVSGSASTGAAVGAFLGLMAAFPLLAIGLTEI